ncbi:hypothetical protein KGP36_03100 [Patescibacteria group bacterium]|nr:hypothetical protein [Patescibacteria group bacterium]
MSIRRHGGKCCGITHIYDLYDFLYTGEGRFYENLMAACKKAYLRNKKRFEWFNPNVGGHTIEVVTANQARFDRELENNGWNLSYSFVNGNSGNVCRVYHKTFTSEDQFNG